MEAVENAALPGIEIYCGDLQSEQLAANVGYGIEEEGIPYRIIAGTPTYEEAHEYTRRAGLGVIVLVSDQKATVFTRQLREPEPLLVSMIAGSGPTETEAAKTVGKNSARIVKNKPFLEMEE